MVEAIKKHSIYILNTINLAPMVRLGTLPLRLYSIRHGADYVWTDEIIDRKFIMFERTENPALNTVDYLSKRDGSLIFRTKPCEEKAKLIV